jgi:hypothetical protein
LSFDKEIPIAANNIFHEIIFQKSKIKIEKANDHVPQTGCCQRSAASRQLRTSERIIFLLKIKILAKRKREFTTKFAIARNGCWR